MHAAAAAAAVVIIVAVVVVVVVVGLVGRVGRVGRGGGTFFAWSRWWCWCVGRVGRVVLVVAAAAAVVVVVVQSRLGGGADRPSVFLTAWESGRQNRIYLIYFVPDLRWEAAPRLGVAARRSVSFLFASTFAYAAAQLNKLTVRNWSRSDVLAARALVGLAFGRKAFPRMLGQDVPDARCKLRRGVARVSLFTITRSRDPRLPVPLQGIFRPLALPRNEGTCRPPNTDTSTEGCSRNVAILSVRYFRFCSHRGPQSPESDGDVNSTQAAMPYLISIILRFAHRQGLRGRTLRLVNARLIH